MNNFKHKTAWAMALWLMAGNASAANIMLSGNYIFTLKKICQATDAISFKPGDISGLLLQVKATPNSTGVAGTMVVSGYNDIGSNLLGSAGSVMVEKTITNTSLAYSNTATTFTIASINGGQPFHVFYGGVDANHIAHYAAMMSLTNDNNVYTGGDPNKCTSQATLVRQ